MLTTSKLCLSLLAVSLTIGMSAVNADNCGIAPSKPKLLKGKHATSEALIANSKEVKDFVAQVDTYLDCREAEMVTEAFQLEDKKVKKAADKEVRALLKQRNAIGDAFNKQVKAFRKANPDS